MTEIQRALQRAIMDQGSISFAQFMDICLYTPGAGYYENDDAQIGRAGDFYTSVSTGPLFGQLLGYQFGTWLEKIPGQVSIVEAGAHDGRLATDILAGVRRYGPQIAERIQYLIVEPSDRRQRWQMERLKDYPWVRWVPCLKSLRDREIAGIIFSNELLDALPFHLVSWNAETKRWDEKRVAGDDKGFHFCYAPLSAELEREISEINLFAAADLKAAFPHRFTMEVSPGARQWWRTACKKLGQGHLVTIDYGLLAEEFLHPSRLAGTARAYRRHQQTADLLANPGQQDITAHVNFTALRETGEAEGLTTESFVNQGKFLTTIVAQQMPDLTSSEKRQFQTLTHPEHLGRAFTLLAQRR